jgi:hypothetical protein
MPPVTDGRGHVNDSFDELGLLEIRHRVISPLELGAGQAIAVLQRWNHGDGSRRLCRLVTGR